MTLKQRIREFFGLPAVESRIARLNEDMLALSVDAPSLTMFKAMEQKQAERHAELMGALNKLTLTLTNVHALDKPIRMPAVPSWEQVEAQALANLERNPENQHEAA